MKKILLGSVIVTACLIPFFASAQVPFGGVVTAEYTCDTGLLIYVKEAFGIVPFMWLWGELPYLMHIPPHPGQWLLGKAAPATVPCILGYVPIGAGLPIEFHGDSL